MNTEKLIEFLKVGMNGATEITDTLISQLITYLAITTALRISLVAAVSFILWQALSKAVNALDVLKGEHPTNRGWIAACKAGQVLIVCVGLYISYQNVVDVIKPIAAPHIFLIEQGFKLIK